jgi:hypothetical protein
LKQAKDDLQRYPKIAYLIKVKQGAAELKPPLIKKDIPL